MPKKQKLLGFLDFTKTTKHRTKLIKVDIPEETKEDSTLLVCNYCDKKFRNTQGLSVHIKCVRIKCNHTENKVKHCFHDSHQKLEENFNKRSA